LEGRKGSRRVLEGTSQANPSRLTTSEVPPWMMHVSNSSLHSPSLPFSFIQIQIPALLLGTEIRKNLIFLSPQKNRVPPQEEFIQIVRKGLLLKLHIIIITLHSIIHIHILYNVQWHIQYTIYND
jgi:hypothetical protein